MLFSDLPLLRQQPTLLYALYFVQHLLLYELHSELYIGDEVIQCTVRNAVRNPVYSTNCIPPSPISSEVSVFARSSARRPGRALRDGVLELGAVPVDCGIVVQAAVRWGQRDVGAVRVRRLSRGADALVDAVGDVVERKFLIRRSWLM